MKNEAIDNALRPNAIPPLPGIAVMLILGIAVPFYLPLGADWPTQLSESLALERLESYKPTPVIVSPAGEIYSSLPAFQWPENAEADSYELTLYSGDKSESWLGPMTVREPLYVMPSPGNLESGVPYKFVVKSFDEQGQPVGNPIRSSFIVLPATDLLAELQQQAQQSANQQETSLALAGAYAKADSVHDVASALAAYLQAAPEGPASGLALSILQRIGIR